MSAHAKDTPARGKGKPGSQDPWKTSRYGDPYIVRAGLTLAVYRRGQAFIWRATAWANKASVESPEPYLTEEHAKQAALKALPEARRLVSLATLDPSKGRRP